MPVTVTGALDEAVELLPSWPELLSPQHLTEPSESTAQVWSLPAATLVAVLMPVTVTGVAEPLVVELPSWP